MSKLTRRQFLIEGTIAASMVAAFALVPKPIKQLAVSGRSQVEVALLSGPFGGAITELSGGGYERAPLRMTSPDAFENVVFPAATANWPLITHVAVVVGGKMFEAVLVDHAKTLCSGDTVSVQGIGLTA